MGYCFVHAKVYDSKTASALAEDLKGEVVGNQEMVSPELDQVSDASSDVDSGRDVGLKFRVRSRRITCADIMVLAARSR
jgi:hypothetical protein